MTERKTIYLDDALEAIRKLPNAGIHWYVSAEAVFDALLKLPSAQPESFEDKLKEIADALSEKMCYMNTCPNERDIILGYLGRKRSSKNHCNTDCWNEKCESYHYETKQQLEPCKDVVSREDALDVLDEFQESIENGTPCYAKARAEMCNLSSVKSETERQTEESVQNISDDDSISRKAAIDIVEFECGKWHGLAKTIIKEFKQLPSVQPKQDCMLKQFGNCSYSETGCKKGGKMSKENQTQKYESEQLIDELSKMSPMVIAIAYLHAVNYTLYGEDVTEKWVTATQNTSALQKAYQKGYHDAMERVNQEGDK